MMQEEELTERLLNQSKGSEFDATYQEETIPYKYISATSGDQHEVRVKVTVHGDPSACWAKFTRSHNGKPANLRSAWPLTSYWTQSLKFAKHSFRSDSMYRDENVGTNMAEVRFVDQIRTSDGTEFRLKSSNVYPFNATFFQHQHTLVTVDDNCKMIKWDQYGDNVEEKAESDVMAAFASNSNLKQCFEAPYC